MSDFFAYGGQVPPAPVSGAGPAPGRAILGDLGSEEWEQFIAFTARRRYPAGARVVTAGEAGPGLGFIASGELELVDGAGRRSRRAEGEVFGLLSFLDGAPAALDIRVGATGPAELLLLSSEALQQLAAWQPRLALTLLRDLGAHAAARLRQLESAD